MRILITNDDGIHAPGLDVLAAIAREMSDDVWVVAPETDQSGVSHSVTFNDPLRLRFVSEKRFAVRGTPSDCVIMGVRHVLKDKGPDLILSGVNRGHNVAEDVTYSGTIAGAIEGTLLGIRSIALSQSFDRSTGETDRIFDCATAHGAAVIWKIVESGIAPDKLVNINFPACGPDEVQGIAVTRQGQRNQSGLRIEERFDGRHNPYYWIGFSNSPFDVQEGTDLWAMSQDMISVTPLTIDLTDHADLARLGEALSRLPV